jgi:hypothetical protein
VPLYQGFVTYTELDDVTREAIRKEVEAKLNDVSTYYAEIKSSCDEFESKLSDLYLGAMQMQAQKIPEKTEIIEEFFMNLRKEIQTFRLMYGIM